jgi:hypothetical protein
MAIVLNNTLDCAPEVRQPTAATHDTALYFEQPLSYKSVFDLRRLPDNVTGGAVIARPIRLVGNAFQLRFAFQIKSSASFH